MKKVNDLEQIEKDLMKLSKKQLVELVAMQKIGLFNSIPNIPNNFNERTNDIPTEIVPNTGGYVLEGSTSWIPEVFYGLNGKGN